MNERQKRVLRFLMMRYAEGKWTKREEILKELFLDYPLKSDNLYAETNAVLLTRDIGIIKQKTNLIIVSNSQKGIKIGTAEEVEEAFRKEEIALARKWGKLHRQKKKSGLNNQYEMTFNGDLVLRKAFMEGYENVKS